MHARVARNEQNVDRHLHRGCALIEKILRPIIVYIFLVVALRVFGKRELAQLNPFDLVVLLSLSNTVQNAIIGNDNSLTGGLIGAFALLAINYLVVRFLFRHRRLDQIFEGTPDHADRARQASRAEALAQELLTTSELMTVLHRQGFDSAGRGGALRPGARRNVRHPAQSARLPTKKCARRSDARLKDLRNQDRLTASRAGTGVRPDAHIIRMPEEWVSG